MVDELNFSSFQNLVCISMEDMCRELFLDKRQSIKIKKEEVAVKNLVKIFNAALLISNKKGFSAMSLRDLSAEASLSMGALYTYFTSKDELLDMIKKLGRSVVTRVIYEQIEGIDNDLIKLRRAVKTHLYISEVMNPWFYFAYMETKNLRKEEHKNAIEAELFTEGIFIDIIKHGQETGVFYKKDYELTASLIKAMLQDWYLKRWKYQRRKISIEDYAAVIIDIIESYLLNKESEVKEGQHGRTG